MKYSVAIPELALYSPLLKNAEKIASDAGINLIKTNELQVADLMITGKVQAALLTPYSYGLALNKIDYRILPDVAFSIEGYSALCKIYFKQNLKTIKSLAVHPSDEYFGIISRILLAERYDMHAELIKTKEPYQEMIEKYDAVVSFESHPENVHCFDLTDDWFNTYEAPLPIGFWVVRNEEEPENFSNLIRLFKDEDYEKQSTPKFENEIPDQKNIDYEGKVILEFNDEIRDSLDNTMQLLFFHNYFPAVPAVKVQGDETIEGIL